MPHLKSHSRPASGLGPQPWPLSDSLQTVLDDGDWTTLADSCCEELSLNPGIAAAWLLRWPSMEKADLLAAAGQPDTLKALHPLQWPKVINAELLSLALAKPFRQVPARQLLPDTSLKSLDLAADLLLIPILENENRPWTLILLPYQPLSNVAELASRLQTIWDFQRRQQLRKLLFNACEQAGNSMFITDDKGHILWVNEAFSALTGYTLQQVEGRNPRFLNSGRQSDRYYRRLWQTIQSGQVWSAQVTDKDRFGYLYTIDQTITPISDNGVIRHFFSIHDDISHKRSEEIEAQRLQRIDPVSGLLTPVAFLDEVSEQLRKAESRQRSFAVVSLSLINLPTVLDSIPPATAKRLLQDIAHRLMALLKPPARAGHFEDGDFGLLLPDTDAGAVDDLISRLRGDLNAPYRCLESSAYLSLRHGFALYPDDAQTADELWRLADSANGAP